jgi:hypothetical protein
VFRTHKQNTVLWGRLDGPKRLSPLGRPVAEGCLKRELHHFVRVKHKQFRERRGNTSKSGTGGKHEQVREQRPARRRQGAGTIQVERAAARSPPSRAKSAEPAWRLRPSSAIGHPMTTWGSPTVGSSWIAAAMRPRRTPSRE